MTRGTDTMERWFDAYNAHDVEALVALADPEIEIVPLGATLTSPPGATYHGHEGLRSFVQPGFDRWTRLRVRLGIMEWDGDRVIVPLTFVLDDGVTPPATRCAAAVFKLVGDRIRRLRAFDTTVEARAFLDASGARRLTRREREIISLLAAGMNAAQVAESLVISPFTVRTHIRNAKEKLGAHTTAHAIAMALRGTDV
jgi:DNA-binding CsgD family transcriptional regulator